MNELNASSQMNGLCLLSMHSQYHGLLVCPGFDQARATAGLGTATNGLVNSTILFFAFFLFCDLEGLPALLNSKRLQKSMKELCWTSRAMSANLSHTRGSATSTALFAAIKPGLGHWHATIQCGLGGVAIFHHGPHGAHPPQVLAPLVRLQCI